MKIKLLIAIVVTFLYLLPNDTLAQAPDLASAASFALFTSSGAFNSLGTTDVTGDIGTNVGVLTGFPPGAITGEIHIEDAVTAQAALDLALAYSYLSGVPCGLVIGTTLGDGQVLTPNVYCTGAASSLNGDLTLDGLGDPDALFIIQIDGAFSTSTFTNVFLINEASACNVYWQVNGAFSLGDNSAFRGTLLINGAVNLLETSSLEGRALTIAGAISLNSNMVAVPSSGDFFADVDGDGYGDPASSLPGCSAPVGYVSDNTDCNDGDSFVNPGAIEICGNAVDEDCDGLLDNLDPVSVTAITESPVCEPLTITLAASPVGVGLTYQWFRDGLLLPGATNETYEVFEKRGAYSVSISNGDCTVMSESLYQRIYGPRPPVITSFGDTDLCITTPIKLKANFGFAPTHFYQWYLDGLPIIDATTAVYFAIDPGSYSVLVYAAPPGCEYNSEPILLTQDGCRMDANANNFVVIYPNPSHGEITIDMHLESISDQAILEIYNMLGEVIYIDKTSINNGQISESIDLKKIATNGLYTLKVMVDTNTIIKQFVIQQ